METLTIRFEGGNGKALKLLNCEDEATLKSAFSVVHRWMYEVY